MTDIYSDWCRNSRTKPSSQLRADWILFTNVPVATRLVNYRLLNAGYLARRPVGKPLLQKRHRQARFVWARGQLNWCDGHRQQVAFSDESRFLLYRQDGHVRVLRQAHEALLDECVLPRVETRFKLAVKRINQYFQIKLYSILLYTINWQNKMTQCH